MIELLHAILLLNAALHGQQLINQSTSGWCSSVFANVTGPITVTCIGVNPQALVELNRQLNRTKKDLASALSDANTWAQNFHDLEARLEEDPDQHRSRLAAHYLHRGKLKLAKSVLDQIISKDDEKQLDRIARDYYNRGLIEELEFAPDQFTADYEAAYRFRPDVILYAEKYAASLVGDHENQKARDVIDRALKNERQRHDEKHALSIAHLLETQGYLYERELKDDDAEAAYKQSIVILEHLVKEGEARSLDLAGAYQGLAMVYVQSERFALSEDPFRRAIAIQRNDKSTSGKIALVGTLNELGISLCVQKQLTQALLVLQEGSCILSSLQQEYPTRFDVPLAVMLHNIGDIEIQLGFASQAETPIRHALEINRGFSQTHSVAFDQETASDLLLLGIALGKQRKYEESLPYFKESAVMYRKLLDKGQPEFNNAAFNAFCVLAYTYSQIGRERYVNPILCSASSRRSVEG